MARARAIARCGGAMAAHTATISCDEGQHNEKSHRRNGKPSCRVHTVAASEREQNSQARPMIWGGALGQPHVSAGACRIDPSTMLARRCRRAPRWCLLGIFVAVLAPAPSPAATDQTLPGLRSCSAQASTSMGSPSESSIGQLLARLRGGRHRSQAAASQSPQQRVSPSPKQVVLRRTPGPAISVIDVLADPVGGEAAGVESAVCELKQSKANFVRGGGGRAYVNPARSFKDVVAQTAKVEEDAGGPSSRGHLSDVSSSVAAPAPTGSLPAYQDMKSAAGMAPLSQDPCQVGVPTVSSFSDPEPPRASGALSNCLPLPLPSLDLGTGLPARKALSAFAAAAGAASSGRRPPKAPAGKGAGAGGKGAGGQLRVCGGDALRSGDSACEGAFLLRQKLGSGGFGAVYMATDVEHSRKIALKVQQPGKKFCQVALDEVALLSHLTQQRSSLLAALPPGASATDVANAAAAYAVQQSCQMSVAGRRPATTGAEAVDEVVGHSGGAGATDGDAGAEQAKAAALEAGAVAGAECIVRFYGHAIHKGPRGSQICIQMEALGPSLLDLLRHRQYRGVALPLVKAIARDALRGLHFMHTKCGIVHTDIKPENLLLCVGQQADAEESEAGGEAGGATEPGGGALESLVWAGSEEEEEETVLKLRKAVHGKKAGWSDQLLEFVLHEQALEGAGAGPPQLAAGDADETAGEMCMAAIAQPSRSVAPGGALAVQGPKRRFRTEIVDLGNSCFDAKPFTDEIQTIEYRSPEVILRAGYSFKADVWSLACTIFEIVTGEYLFDPKECKSGGRIVYEREEDLLAHHQELLGPLPRALLQRGSRADKFFKADGALRHISCLKPWPLDEVLRDKYGLGEEEAAGFARFLLPMLRLDPEARASAGEMLLHPWLQPG